MELVKSVSIENLVNQRQSVLDRIHQAVALLAEAEDLAKAANIGFPRIILEQNYSLRGSDALTGDYSRRAEALARITKIIDMKAWGYLLDESGLRTFMDSKAREEWSRQLNEGDVPELTLDNICNSFGMLYAQRGEMFERGVINCFRRLSWNYKANSPFKFGKRIIMNQLFQSGYRHPNSQATNELDDLIRVFAIMDGKPEPDHRNGMYFLISEASTRYEREAENEYMHLRWYMKGSGHVTFKRPDLVDKLNKIIVKHYPNALPADRR